MTASPKPADPRVFYEDLVIGQPMRFGQHVVLREEVIDFASKYDPQPFHLDDAAAAKTLFGRLAASGWHSCGMVMAMLVRYFDEIGLAGLGGAGVDQLRWLTPVYPGDTLSVEMVWLDKRRSAKRPDRGIVRQQITAYNQHDTPVMRYIATVMIATRDPQGGD